MRLICWLGLLAAAFVTPTTAQVDPGNMEAIKALRGGGILLERNQVLRVRAEFDA